MIPHSPKSTLIPYTTLFRSLKSKNEKVSNFVCLASWLFWKYFRAPRFSFSRCWSRGRDYSRILSFLPIDCWLLSRSEEHTSELQSHVNLVCRLLLEKKK